MRDKITTFTDLKAWQHSHKLVLKVYKELKDTSSKALKNQMERSSPSITSNIAEGFGRESKPDKKRFYIMARGSAYELQNQLIVARDIQVISSDKFQEMAELSLDSIRLLHGLIRSLNKDNANS
ncbi:MAG: four helix bundle protein [Actinobacteria bacterium]|nr:four helix bundle protein [Actinomycetota bacterium]